MKNRLSKELPIRSKLKIITDISGVITSLHRGEQKVSEELIEDIKSRSLFLDAQIQQDVLIFCEQVAFQYVYDPWHKVTPEVQRAADKLIEDLGFTKPSK